LEIVRGTLWTFRADMMKGKRERRIETAVPGGDLYSSKTIYYF
jgi:hypothetical protein